MRVCFPVIAVVILEHGVTLVLSVANTANGVHVAGKQPSQRNRMHIIAVSLGVKLMMAALILSPFLTYLAISYGRSLVVKKIKEIGRPFPLVAPLHKEEMQDGDCVGNKESGEIRNLQ